METNFNLGSLKVVKPYLEEYIQKSIENIEKNIQIIGVDKKQPEDYLAIDFLDKLNKTLDIIGLKGIAKVFFVCSESVSYVKSGKSNLVNSLEILKKTRQLLDKASIYLNKIIDSGFDQPTKFFNDYKSLADLIELKVSIKDLFFPKLILKNTFNKVIQQDLRFGVFLNENIKKYLKLKTGEALEGLRLNVANLNENIKNNKLNNEEEKETFHKLCHNIYEQLDFLQKIKINRTSYIFFGLSKLYVCCLSPKFNNNINQYCLENNRQITNILNTTVAAVESFENFLNQTSSGDKTASFVLNDSYIQDLLFEMKIVKNNQELTEMPIFKQTENFFDLNYYLNQIDEANAFIDFNDDDNLLSDELKVLFAEIKTSSEMLVNGLGEPTNQINQITQKLKELSIYLEKYKPIKRLAESISIFINNKNENINFNQELSLGILLLEHGIENYINETVNPLNLLDFEQQVNIQIERFNFTSEENKVLPVPKINNDDNLSKVFEDYYKKLKNLEESLDYFLKNNAENIDEINSLPKILSEIKGIFSSIDKKEVFKIIDFILDNWNEVIQKQSLDVNMVDLKESIEFLGGISLIIKAYSENNTVEADEVYENMISKFHKIKLIDENQSVENVFFSTNELNEGFDFESSNNNKVENITTFVGEENMSVQKDENIINNLSDDDWPLLKELETTRFALKNKKKKDTVNQSFEEVIESVEIKTSDNINNQTNESSENLLTTEKIEENTQIEGLDLYTDSIKEEPVEIFWVSDSTNDPELAEIFLIEAQEVFENLEKDFEVLNNDINNKDSLTNIRRYYHTLKGSGRMVGLKYMGEVAWMVEQTLNRCLSDELTFNQDILDNVVEIKQKFQEWIVDLQINNLVNLDIIEIKNKLLIVNDELKNSFDLDSEKNINVNINDSSENISNNEIIAEENAIDLEVESVSQEDVVQNDKIIIDNTEETKAEENIVESAVELVSNEDLLVNDKIIIDNIEIRKEDFDNFNQSSDFIIDSIKNIINISFDEPILLNEEFVNLAKELGESSSLIGLLKMTKLANHIEQVAISSIAINMGLPQTSVNKLRHVVDNLEIFKSGEASEHVAFYESLKEILISLEKEIEEYSTNQNLEENILEEEIDMDKVAQIKMELQEEMKTILEEQNSLIKNILDKLEKAQEEKDGLLQKISSLEEGFENFKSVQEQKEKMFVKALEVNRNDIKVLVDLIKKM